MANLPQPYPRKNLGKKNTLGKEQPLSIIEVIRSPTILAEMISIGKAGNPEITIRSRVKERIQHKKTFNKKHSECYKCGKKCHFRVECKPKAKALINTLQGDQTNKDEIFKLIELNNTDSESSINSSDHEIFQINQSSSSKESSSNFSRNDFYKKSRKSGNYHKFKGKERIQHKKTFDKKHSECYKCGKKGHLRSECKPKAKALFNTLQGDQTNKDEIFKLLELNNTDNDSSIDSSDHEIFQINYSSSSRESSSISSSPDIKIGCKDSCCKNNFVNVLSQQEELLLTLIEQVEDVVVKAQYLSKFQKTLVRETKETKSKHSEPPVNLVKIFSRFTKAKKEIIVNDLQHEIKKTKYEIKALREEVKKLDQTLTILRIEHNFINQRIEYHTSH